MEHISAENYHIDRIILYDLKEMLLELVIEEI
jgi:hypothetical protein